MKNIIKKITLCFLLFFLGLNSVFGAIGIKGQGNHCDKKGLIIENDSLVIYKTKEYNDYNRSSYCSKNNIGSYILYKSEDNSFIVTNKGIYKDLKPYKYNFSRHSTISPIVVIETYLLIIFGYIFLFFFHKHIIYIKKNNILKNIIKLLFIMSYIGLIIHLSLNIVLAGAMATFYRIIPETRIVIFLIFLYYYIQIWWVKNEQDKTFRKLEKPSVIFLVILLIYQYNVSNLIYNHFIPPYHWALIIITINIVYFRKIIKLIKQENCPKLLKYIYILFIVFLLSTIKPYIY